MTDRRQPDRAFFVPIEDAPGPAPPQSQQDADALARSVVARVRASADRPPMPLTSQPGPALPQSRAEAEAIARAVVRRTRGRSAIAGRGAAWGLFAGVALGLVGGALAAVAVYSSWVPPSPQAAAVAHDETPAAPAKPNEPARPTARTPEVPQQAPAPTAPVEAALRPAKSPASARQTSHAARPRVRKVDRLRQANQLRAAGAYRRAEALYARVMDHGADIEARYVATVAVAALRLEHLDKPQQALALYRRALRMRPDGPLTPTVRWGIAEANRVLGDRTAEIQALRSLLSAHPSHPARQQARVRLQGLEQPTAEP